MNQAKNKTAKETKDLQNNFREEYVSLWAFIRTLFVLRTTIISICISIFAGVFVFSSSVSLKTEPHAFLSTILLLVVLSSLRLTVAITRAIYRVEIYIKRCIEPGLGIAFLSNWLDYAKSAEKDNMTRALLPIYFVLNIIALLYSVQCLAHQELRRLLGILPISLIVIDALLFLWNLKTLTLGLYPRRIIREFEKLWAEIIERERVSGEIGNSIPI